MKNLMGDIKEKFEGLEWRPWIQFMINSTIIAALFFAGGVLYENRRALADESSQRYEHLAQRYDHLSNRVWDNSLSISELER